MSRDGNMGEEGLVIRFDNVTRDFGELRAVNGLSLTVEPGTIYAFLGPNGAGKTTALRVAIGLTTPTSGAVYLSDVNVWEEPVNAKAMAGFLPTSPSYYPHQTGDSYLEFLARVRGIDSSRWKPRREVLLDRLGLLDARQARLSTYSFGMVRKITLAGALLHEPSHLLLDEPTAGLDPYSVRVMKNLLLEEKERGAALFVSSHDLDAVAEVADKLGIVNKGVLVRELTRDEFPEATAGSGSSLESLFLAATGHSLDEENGA